MVKGTLNYYHRVFMNDGFDAMIKEIKTIMEEGGTPITFQRLDNFIKAILYGANADGTVRSRPSSPNPHDITKDYDKYKFEKRIFELWINGRNKNNSLKFKPEKRFRGGV